MTDTPGPAPAVTLTLEQALQQAVAHHRAGQLPQAERLYRAILQAQPGHGDAHHNLGLLAVSANQAAAGLPHLEAALQANPAQAQYWFSYIDVLARLGRTADARQQLAQARQLGLAGDAFDALASRLEAQGVRGATPPPLAEGVALALQHREQGRYPECAEVLRAWVATHPRDAGAHALLAHALLLAKQDEAAWQALDAALAVDASLPAVRLTQARLLLRAGRVDESLKTAQAVHQADPADAEAQLVLATAWMEANQDARALPLLDGALRARPDDADALGQRAALKGRAGDFAGARQDAERAVALKPHMTPLWGIVGALRHHFQDLAGAIQAMEKALEGEPGALGHLLNPPFLTRAIEQPWELPATCAAPSIALLRAEPVVGECIARASRAWPARLSAAELFGANGLAALAGDRLLHAMLVTQPMCDVDLEYCLTVARQALLQAAVPGSPAFAADAGGTLGFWCALARQCFINEYVFAPHRCRAAGGQRAAGPAGGRVAARRRHPRAVAGGGGGVCPVDGPAPGAAAAAAVVAGRRDGGAGAAGGRAAGGAAAARRHPAAHTHRGRRVAGGAKPVRRKPYPRWVRIAPAGKPKVVGAELQRLFPLSGFQPLPMFDNPELLIAGCGTGQHSILSAQRFQAARVLAVDLSMASLSYAKRKSQEMGLNQIAYAQADLLRLGALAQRFDVIESAGVLHHLDDPWLGWRTLLSVLRPRGVMRLGFYSEAARRGVVRARAHIAQQGYAATPEGVRQCRRDLVALHRHESFGNVIATPDFYSVSACRDLLFNVQEHRMTLPGINAFLRDNDLRFLGFEINPVVLDDYRQRFPGDPAATDLAQWHAYEGDHPDTFFGMYQFWVQKNS